MKRVAILANGGDVCGFNAVIRAIVKTAEESNIEVLGFIEGYKGLLENNYIKLSSRDTACGIIAKGGSVISSSINQNVFHHKIVKENGEIEYRDMSDVCVQNIRDDEIDCLFTLGGDSTQKSARDFFVKGVNVIGVPKTIDNDVACTEITFGYNTAVSVATEAIDRLHTTAECHSRIMVLEVMGREAGWIALESAIGGGADVCLIPEIPYDINKVVDAINRRRAQGKNFSIVVVSEAAKPKDGDVSIQDVRDNGEGVINTQLGGAGDKVAHELERLTGMTSRCTVLGYLQRGGIPTSFDRVLSTKYGCRAMELALQGRFGNLVVIKNGRLDAVPLEEVVGNNKTIGAAQDGAVQGNVKVVTEADDLTRTARAIGICLGD